MQRSEAAADQIRPPVEEIDYESLTWEDIHLPERVVRLLKESSGIFRYLVD